MERLVLPALLLLIAAAAISCGGTSEDYAGAARTAATASLLTLDDLPDGWTLPAAVRPDGISGTELELQGDCAIFNEANASGFPGAVATDKSPDFIGPESRQAASSATVFNSPESAAAAVDRAVDLIDGCSGEIEAAARRLIDQALEEREINSLFTDVNVDFAEKGFALYGDATEAYRLEASVSALVTLYELTADVIVLRNGPIVAVLTYVVQGEENDGLDDRLAGALAARLSSSAETLPAALLADKG
jgi:hypothetical protein